MKISHDTRQAVVRAAFAARQRQIEGKREARDATNQLRILRGILDEAGLPDEFRECLDEWICE